MRTTAKIISAKVQGSTQKQQPAGNDNSRCRLSNPQKGGGRWSSLCCWKPDYFETADFTKQKLREEKLTSVLAVVVRSQPGHDGKAGGAPNHDTEGHLASKADVSKASRDRARRVGCKSTRFRSVQLTQYTISPARVISLRSGCIVIV